MEDRASVPEPEPEEPEPAARAPTRRKPQRKPKKEVPVGRNGLKKRRVIKSRMTTDDKGYFGAVLLTSTFFFFSPCKKFPALLLTDVTPRSDRGLFVVRIRGRGGAASPETREGEGKENHCQCLGRGEE